MNFTFTGKLGVGDTPIRTGKTKSDADYKSFSGSISAGQNNRAYIELFGMVTKDIKTFDADKNKITIDWDARMDKDVVDSVASFRKNVINYNERAQFVASYDAVEYIENNISEMKDKTFTVTGQVNKNIYNGNITDRFVIQNMYFEDDDKKPVLKVTGDVLWTKDDIDTTDWKSDKKIYINGYSLAYIDKDTGNKYVPQQIVFDCSKIDFNNEKHVNLVKFKLKQIGLGLDGEKVVNNLKAKVVYKLGFVLNYQNGAEEVEFDESQLTKNQREMIALELATIDDFKPKGNIYGQRVTIYKLTNFNLTGDGADGCYDSGLTIDEFDDQKYSVPAPKEEDYMVVEDDDVDDLFG